MTITLPSNPELYEPAALEALFAPLRAMDNAVIDLREAPYVTGAVLSALIVLHRKREAAALPTLRIVCDSSFVRRVVRSADFGKNFPIIESYEKATPERSKSRNAARRA